jgi:glycosyltransferase involved in cell wall biosynthesis
MIFHVITNFSARAGAETMLARLLSASHEGRIVVVSLMDISARNRELAANPNVEYVPLHSRSVLSVGGAVSRLSGLIRTERPSAVLCWMYHAMIVGSVAARMSGTGAPVFWNVRQSLDDMAALTRSSRIAISLAKHLSAMPTGIIYNSSRAMQAHTAIGYSDRNAVVIPNGLDMPAGVDISPRQAKVFGIAGRFHPQKDHETFFKAAALVAPERPDIRFLAAGNGLSRDNPEVLRLINAAGLPPDRIELRGEVDDMASFYREIDCLVLSSRTEGFPNVVAEAMSYGRPVITTDVGDAALVVENTGFIVPPRDKKALAGAMEALLALSPADYASLAAAARKRVEHEYSMPMVASKYRDFLGRDSAMCQQDPDALTAS